MADYTLHCFVESGNAYKPALMLELCGADWEARWVNFFKGEHKSPEYLAQNEMGEVPLLIDHTEGELALSQSGVMLWHLAKKLGKYGPSNEEEERDVLRWILFDNHKLTGNVATYRFLYKFMGKGETPEGEFLKGRMIQGLKVLNRRLEKNDWVALDRASIADISCAGYLFWPDHFGVDWADYPGIQGWLERMKGLDGWKAPEDILPSGPAT